MEAGRADVIVVGAGTSGIPAALFAADRGALVVLLEASEIAGGTLYVSSGHMSAAGTQLQLTRGIQDSPEQHFDDVMRISRNTADPVLVRMAAQYAAGTIDWLIENGFDMGPECPVIAYSHEAYRVPRTYWGREGGKSIAKTLTRLLDNYVSAGKIDLRMSTRMTGLRPNAADGTWTVETISPKGRIDVAAANVVLATGGYGGNAELFKKITNGLPLLSPAPSTSDGSGLEIALNLGGRLRGTDVFLPTLGGVPDHPNGHHMDWSRKAVLTPQYRKPWEIYLNKCGRRFCAEDDPSADAKERALKRQPNLAFWIVYDSAIKRQAPPLFPNLNDDALDRAFENHSNYVTAKSLEELSAMCGFRPDELAEEISAYNMGQSTGRDAFGRSHMPLPLSEPPFYAVLHQGVTLRCWAGIDVDEDLQVVDQAGVPMRGLYAVGEILGGARLSGDSFASGMSVTPAMTFGRLLGDRILNW